jgi:hypothetical protein
LPAVRVQPRHQVDAPLDFGDGLLDGETAVLAHVSGGPYDLFGTAPGRRRGGVLADAGRRWAVVLVAELRGFRTVLWIDGRRLGMEAVHLVASAIDTLPNATRSRSSVTGEQSASTAASASRDRRRSQL